MAAPRRNTPVAQVPIQGTAPALGTSLLAKAHQSTPPMRVRAPGVNIDDAERSLVRFSQIIMLGIAIAGIWFSIYNIAFSDEGTSNADFAVLFFGGMLSAGFAIGWIEAQSRVNDHQLRDVQDYMLGIGFFFATVGTVWGARFIIGLFESGAWFGQNTADDGWYPNGNGIYVQTAAILLLMMGQYKLLQRYKGQTTFGWAVASYAPMIVLLGAGMNIWLKWSGDVVSYEIGISLIVLSIAAMEMALRSNNSINLTVIVIASSIAPILFEVAHDVTDQQSGGALSLLLYIIAIQGYYASKKELRTDIIQRASLVLIAVIVLAMVYARSDDLNLILGPLTTEALGGFSTHLSLIVALWLAVLGFYFPAMLDQRLPWIPVGLAFALMIIPTDQSTIPWLVTIAILPYMLLISTATRRWVANATLGMAACSFIVVDLIARLQEIEQVETYGVPGLHLLIPVALIAVSELAQRAEKIDIQVHMLVIGCIALSRAVLFAEEWYMPWFFVIYLLYLAKRGFDAIDENASLQARWQATMSAFIANGVMIALVTVGRLKVPEQFIVGGYSLHVFFLGGIAYLLLRSGRRKEFDFGMITNWVGSKVSGAPRYDPGTNSWIETAQQESDDNEWIRTNSWSPLARSSLVIPFIMMTAGIFMTMGGAATEEMRNFIKTPIGILLLAFPITGLVFEILELESISSKARSSAVWILFGIGLGPSMTINGIRDEMRSMDEYAEMYVLPAAILLDIILVAAPLIVAWAIGRRGLDKDGISINADLAAMIGLIALACLDTSGGLLLIPMLMLATYQSVRYRHSLALMFAPLALIITQNQWLDYQGIGWKIVEMLPYSLETTSWMFGLSRLSGALIVLQMTYILCSQFTEDRSKHKKTLPWLGAWVWMAIGLIAMFPEMDWFQWMPLLFTLGLMLNAWMNGQVQYLPLLGAAQFVSLIIALGNRSWNLSDYDVFSYASLITGATALLYSSLHENGVLYRNLQKAGDFAYSNIKLPETEEQKEQLNQQFQIIGYIGLTFSFTILWGVGTMIGAVMLTRKVVLEGQFSMLLLSPLVHSLALYNFLIQTDALSDALNLSLIGGLLIAEGLAFITASIKNDVIYDQPIFDWPSDETFFEFMDRLGIMGVGTTIAGIFFLLNNDDWNTLAFGLTTVVLIGVGIQGYSPEFEARWRRVLGSYGSIVTTFVTATTLDNDLMQNIGYMLGAIVTMGWIFMSSSRLGDTNELYVLDPNAVQPVETIQQPKEPAVEVVRVAVEVEEAELPELVVPLPIPAPVLVVKERVQTRHGFEIELPDGMFENIITSMDVTPHEGFKPVVSFGPKGEIMLNFVPV
ncbi:MAG: hypothetical protein OSA38_05975 [Candidatus Poseidoniaceae archaeon]|nr:hypothetical protein [Candidatus Poseidoniaceae archaeon]